MTKQQAWQALAIHNPKLSKLMIHLLDCDADGSLTYERFITACRLIASSLSTDELSQMLGSLAYTVIDDLGRKYSQPEQIHQNDTQ